MIDIEPGSLDRYSMNANMEHQPSVNHSHDFVVGAKTSCEHDSKHNRMDEYSTPMRGVMLTRHCNTIHSSQFAFTGFFPRCKGVLLALRERELWSAKSVISWQRY